MKNPRRPRAKTPTPLATAYFRFDGPHVWEIRGAGAMYGPFNSMNAKLRAILDALKSDGIHVARTSSGSPANADEYRMSADFDDGGLAVRTGNYWGSPRGGFVTGVNALRRLILLLNLRVSPQTARAWGLVEATDRAARPSSRHVRRTVRQSRRKSGSRRDLVLDLGREDEIGRLLKEVLALRLAEEQQNAAKIKRRAERSTGPDSTPPGTAVHKAVKSGKK